ncbi:MAG: hypothetical protein GY822_12815 [Deltaproteobacteria bacterium]|nr:hypothetical protein [Deltaproteobacteria bacterium]
MAPVGRATGEKRSSAAARGSSVEKQDTSAKKAEHETVAAADVRQEEASQQKKMAAPTMATHQYKEQDEVYCLDDRSSSIKLYYKGKIIAPVRSEEDGTVKYLVS